MLDLPSQKSVGKCISIMSHSTMMWSLLFIMASASASEQKQVLRVSGLAPEPYMNLKAIKKGEFPAGIDVDVLEIIGKKLNYSYKIVSSKLPTMNINGTWFGGVGELIRDRADVGIGHISLMHPRLRFIDIAYPMYTTEYVMMVVKARALPQHFNLLKAFTPTTWMLTALATLAVCITQPLFATKTLRGSRMDLIETLMFVMGVILHQGQSFGAAQNHSSRISILNWLLFASVIWMAFESDLLSYLISVDYEKEIDTVDDIITTGRPFFTVPGRPSLNAMGLSPRESNQRVMEKSEKEEHYIYMQSSFVENMNTLVEAYGGTNMPLPIYKQYQHAAYAHYGHTPFRKASEILYLQHAGLGFQKGSALTKQFQDQLKYLVGGGIVNQLLVRNMPLERNQEQEDNADVPLNFQHCSLALSLLAIGLLFAAGIFIWELKSSKNRNWGRTKVVMVKEAEDARNGDGTKDGEGLEGAENNKKAQTKDEEEIKSGTNGIFNIKMSQLEMEAEEENEIKNKDNEEMDDINEEGDVQENGGGSG